MHSLIRSSFVRRATTSTIAMLTVMSLVVMSLVVMSLAVATAAFAGAPMQPSMSSTYSSSSSSSSESQSGYDYTGAYVQGALSIGRIDFDGSVDSDASGGFGLGAGYRALPWLAAEIQFQFMGGQQNADLNSPAAGTDRDSEFFAFTVGPKIYPLGLFEIEEIPDNIQPYASMGLGGGEGQIEGGREESEFVARFILGVDVWLSDHLGLYAEGGGYAVGDGFIDGVGTFNVGASWRF